MPNLITLQKVEFKKGCHQAASFGIVVHREDSNSDPMIRSQYSIQLSYGCALG